MKDELLRAAAKKRASSAFPAVIFQANYAVNANDYAGHTVTLFGTPVVSGGKLLLNDTTDYFTVGMEPITAEFAPLTIEFVLNGRKFSASNYQNLMTLFHAPTAEFILSKQSNSLYFTFGGTGVNVLTSYPFTEYGTKIHLAMTIENKGGTLRFTWFWRGVRILSHEPGLAANSPLITSSFVVGAYLGTNFFNGDLDAMRITRGAIYPLALNLPVPTSFPEPPVYPAALPPESTYITWLPENIFSEGTLTLSANFKTSTRTALAGGHASLLTTKPKVAGKFYAEVTFGGTTAGGVVGLWSELTNYPGTYIGSTSGSVGLNWTPAILGGGGGAGTTFTAGTVPFATNCVVGDVFCVAVDMAQKKCWIARNAAVNVGGAHVFSWLHNEPVRLAGAVYSEGETLFLNSGDSPLAYAMPATYSAW